MISLRLSDVEYEFLKTRYRAYGTRSVSDLARLALQRMMHNWDTPGSNVSRKLASLDGRIATLESRLSVHQERENAPPESGLASGPAASSQVPL
jgi:hypothetical protein